MGNGRFLQAMSDAAISTGDKEIIRTIMQAEKILKRIALTANQEKYDKILEDINYLGILSQEKTTSKRTEPIIVNLDEFKIYQLCDSEGDIMCLIKTDMSEGEIENYYSEWYNGEDYNGEDYNGDVESFIEQLKDLGFNIERVFIEQEITP